MDARRADTVVVGAGLSGLCTAWRAARAGRDVVVLEASGRVGGVVRTDSMGGFRVERAAAAFPSTATHLLDVLASLPRAPAVRTPPDGAHRQFLWTRHGLLLLPRSPLALLASPLLSASGRVRALAEALRGPRRARASETAFAFARRRFGARAAHGLLRPATQGIHGSPPEALGVADAFPALAGLERAEGSVLRALRRRRGAPTRDLRTFEGGMEAFPRAIAEALAERVALDAPVEGLEPDAGGLTVRHARGAVAARAAVLATTADAQARLVAPLSRAASELLAAVAYAPMVVVSLGIATRTSATVPAAFGFLRAPSARGRILGASFPSAVDPSCAPEGRALLTVFLGGGADPGALTLDDATSVEVAARDVERALDGPLDVVATSVVRWPHAIPVLAPGHRARMATAARLLAPHGVSLWGSHVTGVGLNAVCAPRPSPSSVA